MPIDFEFHRSIYLPPNPQSPVASSDLLPGTEFVVPIGKTGGNFFNWTSGRKLTTDYNLGEAPVEGDDPNPSNFAIYPLKPTGNALGASVEVYLRGYFGGTFTQVTNVRLYPTRLDLKGYGDGAQLNWYVKTQYPVGDDTLIDGTNSFAFFGIPFGGPHFLEPGTDNGPQIVAYAVQSPVNSSQGYLDLTTGVGITPSQPYSKYAVMQLVTGTGPTPGEGGRSEFTLVYDES